MKGKKYTLAPVELLLMKAIWKTGKASVQEVRDAVAHKRNLAYTTVLSMMRTLERKGFLAHSEDEDRRFIYRPLVSEKEVTSSMLKDILNRVFDGSKELLLAHLFDVKEVDDEELALLRKKLSEFEKGKKQKG